MAKTTANPQNVGNPSRELLTLVIAAYIPLFAIIWIASTFRSIVFSDVDIRGIVGLGLMYSALAAAELYGFARKNISSIADWADNRSWFHRILQLSALAFVILYGFAIAAYSALYSAFNHRDSVFGWVWFSALALAVVDTLLYGVRNCKLVCNVNKEKDASEKYQSPK